MVRYAGLEKYEIDIENFKGTLTTSNIIEMFEELIKQDKKLFIPIISEVKRDFKDLIINKTQDIEDNYLREKIIDFVNDVYKYDI